jgi:murein DD-endopeptidase MepM/ murein hydrolase activator NlpD
VGTKSVIAAVAALWTLGTPPALRVTVAARDVQPGEVVKLTIDAPPGTARVRARAFDREIACYRLDGDRWQAIVGIDLDVKPATYRVTLHAGSTETTEKLVVAPKTFRTRRLTVDPDFVTPPPSAAERIERDAKLLASTWQSSAPERLWSAPFERPVQEPANSAFGTRSIFNGMPRNAHGGADFLSPAGTPIRAPNAGRALVARDLYFSGNTIIIDHGLGLFSMLAHLSSFDIQEGDSVTADQIVGRVGATGRVTGAHLHWAVRLNGARVDPLSLLAVVGEP